MESVSNLWKILFEYNTIDYQVDMVGITNE